ncbi:MAG: hypothetical protein J3K34DRAFT_392575, partial [Monoraphidium minutum]
SPLLHVKAIQVQLQGQQPRAVLHLLVTRKSHNKVRELVALPQLKHSVTSPLGISRTAFYRAAEDLLATKRKSAGPTMLVALKKLGAIPHKSSKCELVSLSAAAKMLRAAAVPSAVVESMLARQELVVHESSASSSSSDDVTNDDVTSDDVIVEDDYNPQPPEAGDLEEGDQSDHDLDPEPDLLEDLEGTQEPDLGDQPQDQPQLLAGRYGLNSIKDPRERRACMDAITPHMSSLQTWSHAIYQPGRPNDMRQLGAKSWESQRQRVHEYLGYLYHHQGVYRPTLGDYLNITTFTAFMDFIKSRGVDKAAHTKAVFAAVRVVSWLQVQPGWDRSLAKDVLKWLKSMGAQLGANMVPKPKVKEPEALKEQGKWMDAPELMARVEAVRLDALQQVAAFKAGTQTKLEAAGAVHNALLATMVFRHTTTGKWHLEVPHHKNSRAWQGAAIRVQLPPEVEELLQHHLTWGHRCLTIIAEDVQPTMFVNISTGAPLKDQEVSKVWSKTVLEGTGVHFGPQRCKSIFVTGTRDQGLPTPNGMAMLMGNSQAVWDSVYDKHFNTREAGVAMASMPSWRLKMLQEAQEPC